MCDQCDFKGVYLTGWANTLIGCRFIIKFKKLDPEAIIPSYKKDGDSGFDLHAIDDYIVKQDTITNVQTGLSIELPDQGSTYPLTLELQIRPRSGLAMKEGIIVVNTPGTVDNGYRGELVILLTRMIPGEFAISKFDRIAQGVVNPIISRNVLYEMRVVDELNNSDRGTGGFGHTGVS